MHIHMCDLNKHFSINSKHMGFYFVIPSPRFELPMGAAEQPTLPQQVQSHQKVCEFIFYNFFFFSKTGLMFTLILMFHLKFNLQQQNMQPVNRSSQSLIQLTNTNVNNNQRMPYAGGIVHSNNHMGGPRGPRPLDQVTCYKVGRHLILCFFSHTTTMPSNVQSHSLFVCFFQCGEKGHYANKCSKGHLAFLSGQ